MSFVDEPEDEGLSPYDPRVVKAINELCEECRRVGVYDLEVHPIPSPDGRLALVVTGTLGDVAFRKQVQDPEQTSFDKGARVMELDETKHDFAQKREELRRRAAEGKSILGDEGGDA